MAEGVEHGNDTEVSSRLRLFKRVFTSSGHAQEKTMRDIQQKVTDAALDSAPFSIIEVYTF